jgi:transcriptional regulator with XRE-family HTH domain
LRLPRLKEVRELHGWSQARLAEESGVSRDSISNYETGQREAWPATAKRLADALGVDIADLREPARELATSGKVEAPREAGHSRARRLEDLQTYEGYISKMAEKYHAETEPLLAAVGAAEEPTDEDLHNLLTLLAQTGWTFDGGYEFLEHDDVVAEAEKGTAAERRALAKVNNALNAIADVHEAIAAALGPYIESDEEESRVVIGLEEYRQQKRGVG